VTARIVRILATLSILFGSPISFSADASKSISRADDDPQVVIRLSRGRGLSNAGIEIGGQDSGLAGPNSIDVASDGRLFILDQLNRRVLIVAPWKSAESTRGGAGKFSVTETLRIASTVKDPVAMVILGATPIVLDKDNSRASAVSSGVGNAESAGASEIKVATALALFSSQGLMSISRSQINPPHRAESSGSTGTNPLLIVRGPGSILYHATVERLPGGRSAVVEFRSAHGSMSLPTVYLKTSGRFGSVQPLRVASVSGENVLFLKLEEFNSGRPTLLAVQSYRFSRDGPQLQSRFVPPVQLLTGIPDQAFAVDEKGQVFFLSYDKIATTVWRLLPADATSNMPEMADGAPEATDGESSQSGRSLRAQANAISREEILRRAMKFVDVQPWRASETTFRYARPDGSIVSGTSKQCLPKANEKHEWAEPVRLQGHKSGETFEFIPYGWGRRADANAIIRQLNQGASAGNVCTCEPACILEKVAGIDCSGLVGQIWDAPRFTTASISAFALSLGNDWSQLRPGDVVSAGNASQRHMMMVTATRSNGASNRYDLIQASVGPSPKYCSGSVCITSWESSQLERLGYTIYRHPGLSKGDGG
jgi:hypothetical protein